MIANKQNAFNIQTLVINGKKNILQNNKDRLYRNFDEFNIILFENSQKLLTVCVYLSLQ